MRLGLRLLLGFFIITGIAGFFVMRVFMAEIKPSVREVMEDLLVDTANILSELVADDLASMPANGDLMSSHFAQQVQDYANRPVDAKIWGVNKRSLDYRVYVTDATGKVVFDTGLPGGGNAVGQDYSQWRDVSLTLSGRYGARATRETELPDSSSILYVAAPVKQGDQIIGVLTVSKPMRTVQKFIQRAELVILKKGGLLVALSAVIGLLVTGWLVWSIRRLRRYAQRVQFDQKEPPPQLSGELGELAQAMADMRDRLDGHAHVEQLVRALTHELKSPLTAISGAAELLADDLPSADRERFALHIKDQSDRLHQLVERLLELSKLEHRQSLEAATPVDLSERVAALLSLHAARIQQRKLQVICQPSSTFIVHGDRELIDVALSNVIDNAVAFSSLGGRIDIDFIHTSKWVEVSIRDHGVGVPDYAIHRLGERFYSTTRPLDRDHDSPQKGSGLGLPIVKQIMTLHGGDARFEQVAPGFKVILCFPAPHFTQTSHSSSRPH